MWCRHSTEETAQSRRFRTWTLMNLWCDVDLVVMTSKAENSAPKSTLNTSNSFKLQSSTLNLRRRRCQDPQTTLCHNLWWNLSRPTSSWTLTTQSCRKSWVTMIHWPKFRTVIRLEVSSLTQSNSRCPMNCKGTKRRVGHLKHKTKWTNRVRTWGICTGNRGSSTWTIWRIDWKINRLCSLTIMWRRWTHRAI